MLATVGIGRVRHFGGVGDGEGVEAGWQRICAVHQIQPRNLDGPLVVVRIAFECAQSVCGALCLPIIGFSAGQNHIAGWLFQPVAQRVLDAGSGNVGVGAFGDVDGPLDARNVLLVVRVAWLRIGLCYRRLGAAFGHRPVLVGDPDGVFGLFVVRIVIAVVFHGVLQAGHLRAVARLLAGRHERGTVGGHGVAHIQRFTVLHGLNRGAEPGIARRWRGVPCPLIRLLAIRVGVDMDAVRIKLHQLAHGVVQLHVLVGADGIDLDDEFPLRGVRGGDGRGFGSVHFMLRIHLQRHVAVARI